MRQSSNDIFPEYFQTKTRAPEKGVSERTTADRRRQRVAKKRLKRRRGLVRKPLLAQLKGSGVNLHMTYM